MKWLMGSMKNICKHTLPHKQSLFSEALQCIILSAQHNHIHTQLYMLNTDGQHCWLHSSGHLLCNVAPGNWTYGCPTINALCDWFCNWASVLVPIHNQIKHEMFDQWSCQITAHVHNKQGSQCMYSVQHDRASCPGMESVTLPCILHDSVGINSHTTEEHASYPTV